MLASEWKEGQKEGLKEGRRDGGQVVGTDNCAQGMCEHADLLTQFLHVIHPAHGLSILFMTVLYLQFLTPLYVCDGCY